jgi:hypothetical protein
MKRKQHSPPPTPVPQWTFPGFVVEEIPAGADGAIAPLFSRTYELLARQPTLFDTPAKTPGAGGAPPVSSASSRSYKTRLKAAQRRTA